MNPDKGYLVNSNNFIASERMEYGISHAINFNHRKVRISEMIEEVINNGNKITVEDTKRIQSDYLDIQMRHSIPDMISTVKKGLKTENSSYSMYTVHTYIYHSSDDNLVILIRKLG